MRERQAGGGTNQYEQGSKQGEGQGVEVEDKQRGCEVKFILSTKDAQYATN
jgi:hypothetical protein